MDAVNGVTQSATSQAIPAPILEAEKNGKGTLETPIVNENSSTDAVAGEGAEAANKKRPLTTTVEDEGNPAKIQKGVDGTKQSDKQTTVTNETESDAVADGPIDPSKPWGVTNENLEKLFNSIPPFNKQDKESEEGKKAEEAEQPAGSTDQVEGKQSQIPASSSAVALSVGDQTQNDTSFTSASGMVGDDSTMDEGMGDVGEVLYARNGRPLNRTKRAAQNRAAQRAFRARRDEYVRQTEEKAKLTDGAVETAKKLKNRLDQSIEIIGKLRDQNEELRKLVESLGGNPPPAVSVELLPFPDEDVKMQVQEQKSALESSSSFSFNDDKPERKTAEENARDLASLSAVAVAAAASVSALESSEKVAESANVEPMAQ